MLVSKAKYDKSCNIESTKSPKIVYKSPKIVYKVRRLSAKSLKIIYKSLKIRRKILKIDVHKATDKSV